MTDKKMSDYIKVNIGQKAQIKKKVKCLMKHNKGCDWRTN